MIPNLLNLYSLPSHIFLDILTLLEYALYGIWFLSYVKQIDPPPTYVSIHYKMNPLG